MSARLDDAINYAGQTWGQRNDVIVTINGDFEMPNQWGVSASGLVHSGWYAKRFTNMTGGSGFAWMMNRYPIIGGCVYHRPEKQIVKFAATGNTMEFSSINTPREYGQLFIYTPQYGASTGTNNEGVEVVVELTRPLIIIPLPNKVVGYVREIRQNLRKYVHPVRFGCSFGHGQCRQYTAGEREHRSRGLDIARNHELPKRLLHSLGNRLD